MLETRGWYLTVVHVGGASNVLTDALSRDSPIATEWGLEAESFGDSQSRGETKGGLVGHQRESQISQYVSPILDDRAIGVDAFKRDWDSWKTIYIFPTVKKIPKVLFKYSTSKDWWG